MRFYELTYLLSSEFSEGEIKKFLEEMVFFIKERGGILEGDPYRDKITKRKLPSPINKEKEAYLSSLNFYLQPLEIEKLKTKLDSEKRTLRYIILSKKVPKKEVKAPRIFSKIPRAEKETKVAPEKVDLKEIEKKLEEILNE